VVNYTEQERFKWTMAKVKVEIIESERGWGQRVDEVKEFDTREEAEDFCKKYNASNNLSYVPDWYHVRSYCW
jgi:hypothetical protein